MKTFITYFKEFSELLFWKYKLLNEKKFTNTHYEYFYTKHFDLEKDFYTNKNILDIGCGPRGSLNWAENANKRIGLDPLANKYLKLGIDSSKMEFINAYSENIPFEKNYFDVVCSFNSLDHVVDMEKTLIEIKRVLKPDGLFLLIIDMHAFKTITEPHVITWEISKQIEKHFTNLSLKKFEKDSSKIYSSIMKNIAFDNQNSKTRYGILTAKFKKEIH